MNSEFPISFGSDNHSGIHPDILAAIQNYNVGHAPSYGTDPVTDRARAEFTRVFGPCSVYFVFNGTAANVLSIAAGLRPYESVLCTEVSHLNTDECGAPERITGCKLIPIPEQDGKMNVSGAQKAVIRKGDQHFSQVRMISLTQPTELGTTYSLDEMRAWIRWARSENLLIHIDGARLANAAVTLGCSLRELAEGVDVISFGGTKNGLMGGEAIVFLNPVLAENFKYIQKQCMQLPSKSRFISVQFLAYLEKDRYMDIARHVTEMAKHLEARARTLPGIQITRPVQSNAVFATVPRNSLKRLREKYFFYVWDEDTFEVRWMTSFNTEKAHVDDFVASMKNVLGELQQETP